MSKFLTVAFLVFFELLFCIRVVLAQLPGDVSSQIGKLTPKPAANSPNAEAIQKYGDFNVNLCTGIPDTSIPLFEIVSRTIKVPIVLSYHSGGVRYSDRASWVGFGWSVQSGGQITRTNMGKADEESFLTITNDYTVDPFNYCTNFPYIEFTAGGSNDREPDLFSYDYPSGNGRFLIKQGLMNRFGGYLNELNGSKELLSSISESINTSGITTGYLNEIKKQTYGLLL